MVIEINKDIDKYQESVALGLTARQLLFSIASVVIGGGIVLLLYRYIGLTGAAYVAIPCVAPVALGGFYSFNGMNFYEYMGRKLKFMFANPTLCYVSTEGEAAMRAQDVAKIPSARKKQVQADKKEQDPDAAQEEFEATKRKMKKMLIGLATAFVLAIAGAAIYKALR